MLTIIPIPAFQDNYIWLLQHKENHALGVIIDPGESEQVIRTLQARQLDLAGILLTHHHFDHTGGVAEIVKSFPCPVYGPRDEAQSLVTHPLSEGDTIQLVGCEFNILDIPGHTLGHIAYVGDNKCFCGDTLFLAGCGRVFEGNPEQMWKSLQKIKALPPQTEIYCAHEYTEANLRFALAVEPENQAILEALKKTQSQRQHNQVTIPHKLAREFEINPFLRTDIPTVVKAASEYAKEPLDNEIRVFSALRRWKNGF